MTTTFTVDKSFAYIDRLTKHGSVFAACAGMHNRIILAFRGASAVNVTGVSDQLTAQPLDIVSNGTPSAYYVLTPKGITTLSAATNPVITAESVFDTGSNRWLFYSSGNLITPTAQGGVRLQTVGGTVLATLSGILCESTAAAFSGSTLYVFCAKTGKMAVVTVTATALVFEGLFDAPNCREILRAVIDGTNLYCLNRNRVVCFSIATATSPTLAQDYGKSAVEFTDVAVVATGKLWFGFLTSTPGVTGPEFFGPLYGVWDSASQEIQTAAPRMSAWMVNNVIPYYTSATIPTIIPTPPPAPVVPPVVVPPVIAPAAPVITSALTASVTEDTLFGYTITATGTGPISYGVVSAPVWLTGINALSGVISGTPPDPSTVSITITATNAGGTASATLVVTVDAAIGNMSAVSVIGNVVAMTKVNNLLYLVGGFSQVTDSSGTLSRANAACINMVTGLWTTWNPSPAGGNLTSIGYDGTWIYLGGVFTTVNGAARQSAARVHPTTGANDSWAPTFSAASAVTDFLYDGTSMWLCGGFTTVNGSAHEYVAKFTPLSGALSSWRAIVPQMPTYPDRYLAPQTSSANRTFIDYGGAILLLGGLGASFDVPGNVKTLAKGFISVDKGSGIIAQSTHSVPTELNSQNHGAAVIGGLVYTTCPFGISSYQNVPSGTDAATGLPGGQQVVLSGTSVVTGFAPGFYNLESDWLRAYAGVGSNILIAGGFSRLSGDTSKRYMQLVTPSGALAPGFTGVWAVSLPTSVKALLDLGGGNVAVGIENASLSTTYNGMLTQGLMFITGASGARY